MTLKNFLDLSDREVEELKRRAKGEGRTLRSFLKVRIEKWLKEEEEENGAERKLNGKA